MFTSLRRNTVRVNTGQTDKKLLLVAILLGVLAGGANLAFMTKSTGARLNVLRAKAAIPAGTVAARDLFEELVVYCDRTQIRNSFLPAADFHHFEGQRLVAPLQPDEILLLRSFDRGETIPVPPGKRAISVKVQDDAQAVGYLIRPTHSVDIWGWIGGRQHRLVEKVCVAAIGSTYSVAAGNDEREIRYSSITIIVNEADVEALTTNLKLTGEQVTLALVGGCDPTQEAKVAPVQLVTPGNETQQQLQAAAQQARQRAAKRK
jgi:Flp pilus assembly protein CpaB